MKKSTIVTIILIAAAVVLGVIFISWYLRKATPLYIQGTVENVLHTKLRRKFPAVSRR